MAEFTIAELKEFRQNRVFVGIQRDQMEQLGVVRNKLEQCTVDELGVLQGEAAALRQQLSIIDVWIEALEMDIEEEEDSKNGR